MARARLFALRNIVVVDLENDTLGEHNDALVVFQRVLRNSDLVAPTRVRIMNGQRCLLDALSGTRVAGLRWADIPDEFWVKPFGGPAERLVADPALPPVYPTDKEPD